jgi:hypothetical protein
MNQPRETLTWEDIKEQSLTWSQLRKMGLSAEHLREVQTDKDEWVARGGLSLKDTKDMLVLKINPFLDMKADFAEVWAMGWSAEDLVSMGVTIEQMISRGMTNKVMPVMKFSLNGWLDLGFNSKYLENMNEGEVYNTFGMSYKELMKFLQEIEKDGST